MTAAATSRPRAARIGRAVLIALLVMMASPFLLAIFFARMGGGR